MNAGEEMWTTDWPVQVTDNMGSLAFVSKIDSVREKIEAIMQVMLQGLPCSLYTSATAAGECVRLRMQALCLAAMLTRNHGRAEQARDSEDVQVVAQRVVVHASSWVAAKHAADSDLGT